MFFASIEIVASDEDSLSLSKKAWNYAKKEVKVSGGVSASSVFYLMNGIGARRDPFFWVINANMAIRFKEISIPFSISFSQQNSSYTRLQPFNQFGMSPKYKFLTLHLGYRSMNFSEYTLAGNIFLGVGVEVNHQKFPIKFSVLGGRFAKAFDKTDDSPLKNYPSYERWGYGTKITIEKGTKSLSLILFRASDNATSLSDSMATALKLKPAENIVIGTTAKFPLGKNINFNGEYALSSFNPDIRLPESRIDDYSYLNNLGGMFTPRINSQYNAAFKGNLEFVLKTFRVNLMYRRVGPEYKTLGSTFLNNDYEDITTGVNWQMFKKKLSVATNGGFQRNNLADLLFSTMIRVVGGVNLTYAASEKLSFTGNYSNFNSSTELTPFVFNNNNNIRPDSLKFLQVTNSAGGGFNYSFGKKEAKKVLFTNLNFQKADDNKGVGTTFYNINTGLTNKLPYAKLDVNSSVNFTSNLTAVQRLINVGPILSLTRPIVNNKIKLSLSSSFLNTIINGSLTGNIINSRFSATYTFLKKHNLSFELVYVVRNSNISNPKSFQEMRGGLNYSWGF
ncbi:MAG: hypothetical protein EAZ53_16725 [Bacteroidetes bacterium]|nr:MAG: hypothetical protein EAZ53_16725 [Bacteroidota bacterium]